VADGSLSSALAEAREAIDAMPREFAALPLNEARASFAAGALWATSEKLLKAVEAALSHHERVPLYGNAATDDEPGACPHDPDDPLHFEDDQEPGELLCRGKPEGVVCSCTESADGERLPWPCDEVTAILAALTGKDAPSA